MNILQNLFLFNKKSENNKDFSHAVFDHYKEIAKLVKEARIQQKLTIKELSEISKIPAQTIDSIENNKVGFVDPFYDLAKLNHSFTCFYDSVVNNMFSISYNKDQYQLKIFKPFNYEIANFYFQKIDKLMSQL